ncbi:MAG TPA: PDZ domain-containing protein [Candidatus Omnitrophota bacterium]|mgnify:CR=1 FL=1|nr:PDZ domain-containing protein [Candidatus Omnitrophota bacterium]HQJ15836.1 PDZ domain-containing protein [Candidatus Omnitrophota bacterium]
MKLHKDLIWVTCVAVTGLLAVNIFVQNRLRGPALVFNVPEIKDSKPAERVSVARRLSARQDTARADISIKIELWGTILGNPSMAFLFNPDTEQQGLFKLNDTFNGFRLVKISSGRVVLEKDGDAWELALKANNRNRQASGKAVVFSDPESGTVVVNKTQLVAQMLQSKDMFSKIKLFPISDPDSCKLGGFKVDNVPSGSVIEEAGIRNGDVIYSVQGQKLQTIQDAWAMFARVQTQSRVEVVLLRDNQPLTIKYEIK